MGLHEVLSLQYRDQSLNTPGLRTLCHVVESWWALSDDSSWGHLGRSLSLCPERLEMPHWMTGWSGILLQSSSKHRHRAQTHTSLISAGGCEVRWVSLLRAGLGFPTADMVSVRSPDPDSLVLEDPTFPHCRQAYWEGGEAGVWKKRSFQGEESALDQRVLRCPSQYRKIPRPEGPRDLL